MALKLAGLADPTVKVAAAAGVPDTQKSGGESPTEAPKDDKPKELAQAREGEEVEAQEKKAKAAEMAGDKAEEAGA